MALHKEIGRSRLPELLLKKGLIAREFADKIGVSESHISRIISGKSYFSYPLAARATEILNCTMEELHEWPE